MIVVATSTVGLGLLRMVAVRARVVDGGACEGSGREQCVTDAVTVQNASRAPGNTKTELTVVTPRRHSGNRQMAAHVLPELVG